MSLETRQINSGSGLIIDGFDENNSDKFVQSVYLKYDVADFGGQATSGSSVLFNQQTTTGISSTEFNCAGRSKLIFKVEYNNSSALASFYVFFKDYNVTPFWRVSSPVTPTNLGVVPGSPVTNAVAGFFHGASFSIDTLGAKTMTLYLASLSVPGTDRVSVWVCGV